MTTIAELFAAAAVGHAGVVPWCEPVPLDRPGIYIVATTPEVDDEGGLVEAPIGVHRVAELLRIRPEAALDGSPATSDAVIERLRTMWVPGEPAVYVGLAGASVRRRVDQFYKTRIGARAPHAGGWPIKMLDTAVAPLWVHFGAALNPDEAEIAVASCFMRGVSSGVRDGLIDPSVPLPFANLTVPRGQRKRHGFSGVKAPRAAASRATTSESPLPSHGSAVVTGDIVAPSRLLEPRRRRTQPITSGDIRGGYVRIPSVSKDILPAERTLISVYVDGMLKAARWDPRTSGNRSGVIGLGARTMRENFAPGVQCHILEGDGVYTIV